MSDTPSLIGWSSDLSLLEAQALAAGALGIPNSGWKTPTGTLDRSDWAAYEGQTISDPPTQAEMQALDDAVKSTSQHLAALITDLLDRGIISA